MNLNILRLMIANLRKISDYSISSNKDGLQGFFCNFASFKKNEFIMSGTLILLIIAVYFSVLLLIAISCSKIFVVNCKGGAQVKEDRFSSANSKLIS